jgi:hypothetical protein
MRKANVSGKWIAAGGAAWAVVLIGINVQSARGYPTYTVNEVVNTNCGACHGDFRSNNYVSNTDGMDWGNLHNLHRFDMLDGDCSTCHGASNYPVVMNSSEGGVGFEAIGCMGCHGRNQDTNRGAGLRQHHYNAGTTVCANCHPDSNPANYTPVGEDVLPSYYFTPDANHPNKPTNACSPNGEEDYAGILEGLDNDGDGLYDGNDPDCADACPCDCADGGDGVVNVVDFLALIAEWGGPGACDCADGRDGIVNVLDFLAIIADWGPC